MSTIVRPTSGPGRGAHRRPPIAKAPKQWRVVPNLVARAGSLRISELAERPVVVALHARLGVDIPEADYPRLATIDSAVAYLAARLET